MSTIVKALGLMSGTSLDGVDVALLTTDGESFLSSGPACTYPYSSHLQSQLRTVLGSRERTALINQLEYDVTIAHAKAVKDFLIEAEIDTTSISVVGFHGQTIYHNPCEKVSWQLGSGSLLAQLIQYPVISQFRQNDINYGGQGAPLVPVYHRALVQNLRKSKDDECFAIINIGGVANVTWTNGDEMVAFDTGPGNSLLDDWVGQHTGSFCDYQGQFSKVGHVDQVLVEQWLSDSYFEQTPPKSLDRQHFRQMVLNSPRLQELSLEDGSATLAQFTATAICMARVHFPEIPTRWFIAGGGRHNPTFMRFIENSLVKVDGKITVHSVEELGWQGDALEAQAFAYLAVRAQRHLPLTFPSTTGVMHPLTGGILNMPSDIYPK